MVHSMIGSHVDYMSTIYSPPIQRQPWSTHRLNPNAQRREQSRSFSSIKHFNKGNVLKTLCDKYN